MDVIYKIGLVVRHDFSKEFPELFTPADFLPTNKQDRLNRLPRAIHNDFAEIQWKDKYLNLLEDYNVALLHKLKNNNRLIQAEIN